MSKDKRVKNLTGMGQIMLDIKPNRCDSFVYSNKEVDVTNLVKYMEKKRKEDKNITYFHAFMTAFGKVIYNREKLNRFVSNRHMFLHNDIVISFVAKVEFSDNAEEIMLMVPINKDDTIYDISKYIKDKIEGIRNRKAEKKGANSAIDTLGKLPNILRVPVVGLLKWCDKKGILPRSLTEDNLYYSSMIVSNLGSIKSNAIHHNITNFGTCSSLITIGEIKDKKVLINGKEEIRKMCDFGIAFDERVADGFYLIKSMELFEYILNNPTILENKASEIITQKKK